MNSDISYDPLELTEKEIQSLAGYISYTHTQINLLCNMTADTYPKAKKGYFWIDKKELYAGLIDDFVNIYSAMLKLNVPARRPIFYRGSKHNISQTQSNYFISTSKNRDIALSFLPLKDGEISTYSVPEDVPVIDIQNFKHCYLEEVFYPKNEEEFLISPFVKISYNPSGMDSAGNYTHSITVSKQELESIPTEDLEHLKSELINGFDSFLKNIKAEDVASSNYNYFNKLLSNSQYDNSHTPEELEEYRQKRELSNQNRLSLKEKNKDFQRKTVRLIQGLCKQKEIEITQAKEEMAAQQEELRRQQEELRHQQEERQKAEKKIAIANELHKQYSTIISGFKQISQQLSQSRSADYRVDSSLQEMSQNLGINYSSSEMSELQSLYQQIQSQLDKQISEFEIANSFENSKVDNMESALELLKQSNLDLTPITNLCNQLNDQRASYVVDSEHNIKKDLYIKTFNALRATRINYYEHQVRALQSQNTGLFDWITGETTLKEEQIRELRLKQEYEKYSLPIQSSRYSIREILTDIYYTFDVELRQQPPAEIQNLINGINSTFQENYIAPNGTKMTRPFSRERLVQARFIQLGQSEEQHLAPQSSGISKLFAPRATAQTLKTQNDSLERKVLQVRQFHYNESAHPSFNTPTRTPSFAKYLNILKSISYQLQTMDSGINSKVMHQSPTYQAQQNRNFSQIVNPDDFFIPT